MSITFTAIDANHRRISTGSRIEPCSCTQQGDAFLEAMDLDGATAVYSENLLARLRADAWGECFVCKGAGVEVYETALDINFANVNAAALLRALGFRGVVEHTAGCSTVAKLRASLAPMAAHNERIGLGDGRAPEIEYERRGRVIEGELTADGLAARVGRFVAFLDEAERAGACDITWG